MKGSVKGFLPLTRLLFRKDRMKIIIWLLCLIGVTVASALAYTDVYKTETDIMGFAMTMENPAMKAMIGPGYDLEDYTSTAQVFAHELLLFTTIAVGVMNILFVSRATRADEEEGQVELVLSLPVGRLSYLLAAVIEAITINLFLTLLTGVSLYALDIEGYTLEGAFLYSAILGGTGLFFAGITAVFAQLMETGRGATGFSFTVLIGTYIVRAIGDVESETLSLLTPFGWASRAYVFTENEWWPVFLLTGTALLLFVISFYLNSIRDMGAGFIRAKKGRARASALLKNPFGFVLRQQRGNIIAWAFGLFFLSAAFGSIMGELESYFADLDLMQMLFQEEADFSLQFTVLLMAIMAIFGVVPAIIGMLSLKGEEKNNRTELIYSRTVSRNTLMTTYFAVSIIITVIMQLATAAGFWLAASSVMEEALAAEEVFRSALLYLPAMWVLVAIVVLLIGAFPKGTTLIWLYYGFCFLVVYFKDILDLPDWLANLSAFEHIPQYPVEDMSWLPLFALVCVTAVFTLSGFIRYNERDITG